MFSENRKFPIFRRFDVFSILEHDFLENSRYINLDLFSRSFLRWAVRKWAVQIAR